MSGAPDLLDCLVSEVCLHHHIMTLACVAQLTSTGIIADNLAVSVGLIKRAAAAGAKAIFLPEATDFIAPGSSVGALTRSTEARSFVEGIQEAARFASIWVSVGIHEPPASSTTDTREDGRCYNTQLLIDNQGSIQSRYRKNHLFDVDIKGGVKILESDTTIPGRKLEPPQASPIGKIGLLTCYDLRFPEPSLRLRRQGAEILTYPSAFTLRTGAAHWETLLKARAIETQCYVVAAAQVGSHVGTKRVSWGHAMIVDPYGSIISQCSDMQPYQPTLCMADIVRRGSALLDDLLLKCVQSILLQDLNTLHKTRMEMPLWSQRRTDIYSEI